MPGYGRRDSPGEFDIGSVTDKKAVLNRTIRAQVKLVNADNGYVVVNYENMPSGNKCVTVRPLWMSFPDEKKGSPAWGRFMPQEDDLVRVSFDYDDHPVMVGHDIEASKNGVADSESGWPALHDEYQKVTGKSNPPPKTAKFAKFLPLKPGEFDFMSSGGAYIYGNNQGRLYMACGSVSTTMVKNDLRISSRAQLWSHSADDCEIRFGQVRRSTEANPIDSKVASDTNGTFKEFSVQLKTTVSAGVATNLAEIKAGNVVDSSGNVVNSAKSRKPLRYSYRTFDAVGAQVMQMSIDDAGNWDVLAPLYADTGINFDFSAGDWLARVKKLEFDASTSVDIVSPDQTFTADSSFTVESPAIKLGGSSSNNPLILTTVYEPAEKQMVTGLATQIRNLSTVLTTLTTALSGAAAAGASSVSLATAIAAAGTAAAALNAPISIATTTTEQAFNQAYSTYLSQVSKTS